jgi:hypothetical protein
MTQNEIAELYTRSLFNYTNSKEIFALYEELFYRASITEELILRSKQRREIYRKISILQEKNKTESQKYFFVISRFTKHNSLVTLRYLSQIMINKIKINLETAKQIRIIIKDLKGKHLWKITSNPPNNSNRLDLLKNLFCF